LLALQSWHIDADAVRHRFEDGELPFIYLLVSIGVYQPTRRPQPRGIDRLEGNQSVLRMKIRKAPHAQRTCSPHAANAYASAGVFVPNAWCGLTLVLFEDSL
jgi:hypothetical protein